MMFDSSWDWLMPVVDKCFDIQDESQYQSIEEVINKLT